MEKTPDNNRLKPGKINKARKLAKHQEDTVAACKNQPKAHRIEKNQKKQAEDTEKSRDNFPNIKRPL